MNPSKDVRESKWDEFRTKLLNWRNKHREDQLSKVNSTRERSIKILQKRYGYSREKATDELNTRYSGTWLG
jgi:hypothetical protein